MHRQLLFNFADDAETPKSDESPQTVEPQPAEAIDSIAQELRPRILEHLRQATDEVGIQALQMVLGHPGRSFDLDPLSNPVNRILKQMR